MARFIRSFSRKLLPDRVLEISDRVYVLDCCVSTNPPTTERDYKTYLSTVVANVNTLHPGASFMVFNFGEEGSQISNLLSETLAQHDMTVVNFPLRDHNGNPILPLEVIHYFLRSGDSWLSLEGQKNIILMHCEKGGWPILGFMLAGLLLYSNRCSGGEQKAMEMAYKHAPKDLLAQLSVIDPRPSQLRYLHYVTLRNNRLGLDWPPADLKKVIDCVLVMNVPLVDGGRGCRPILRVHGQDPSGMKGRDPQVLFNSLVGEGSAPYYRKEDCALAKMDIRQVFQGDVLIEFVHQCHDLVSEEIIFKIVFHTAFAQSNILHLNNDEVDLKWGMKSKIPKDFQAEVLFSDYEEQEVKDQMIIPSKVDTKEEPVEVTTMVDSKEEYGKEPMNKPSIEEQMKVPTEIVNKEGHAAQQMKVPTEVVSGDGYVAQQMKVPTEVVSRDVYFAEQMKVPTEEVSREGYAAEEMKVSIEVVSKEGYVAEQMKQPTDVFSKEGNVAEQMKLPSEEITRKDGYDEEPMKTPSKVSIKGEADEEQMKMPSEVASKEGDDDGRMKLSGHEVARKEERAEHRMKLHTQLSIIEEVYDEEQMKMATNKVTRKDEYDEQPMKLTNNEITRKDEYDDQPMKLQINELTRKDEYDEQPMKQPTQVFSTEQVYDEGLMGEPTKVASSEVYDELTEVPTKVASKEGDGDEKMKVPTKVAGKEEYYEEEMEVPSEVASEEGDRESDSEFFEAEEYDMSSAQENDMYNHHSGNNQTGPFILEIPDYDGDDDDSVHKQNPDVMITTNSFKDMQLDEDDLEEASSNSGSDASTALNIVMSDDSRKPESEDRSLQDDCPTNGSGRHVIVVAVSVEESDLEQDSRAALVAMSEEESELEQDGQLAFVSSSYKQVESSKDPIYDYESEEVTYEERNILDTCGGLKEDIKQALEVNSELEDNHSSLVSDGIGKQYSEQDLEDMSDIRGNRSVHTVDERSTADSREDLEVHFNANAQKQSIPASEEIMFEDSREDFKVDSEHTTKESILAVEQASQPITECHPEELYWAKITTTALVGPETTVDESNVASEGESEVWQDASETSSAPIGDKNLSLVTYEEMEKDMEKHIKVHSDVVSVNPQPEANKTYVISDFVTETNLADWAEIISTALVGPEPTVDESKLTSEGESEVWQEASETSSAPIGDKNLSLATYEETEQDMEKQLKVDSDVDVSVNPQPGASKSHVIADLGTETNLREAPIINFEHVIYKSLQLSDGKLEYDQEMAFKHSSDIRVTADVHQASNISKELIASESLFESDRLLDHDLKKDSELNPGSLALVSPQAHANESNLLIDWETGVTWQAANISTEPTSDRSLLVTDGNLQHDLGKDSEFNPDIFGLVGPESNTNESNLTVDWGNEGIMWPYSTEVLVDPPSDTNGSNFITDWDIEGITCQASKIISELDAEKSLLVGYETFRQDPKEESGFNSDTTVNNWLLMDVNSQEQIAPMDSDDKLKLKPSSSSSYKIQDTVSEHDAIETNFIIDSKVKEDVQQASNISLKSFSDNSVLAGHGNMEREEEDDSKLSSSSTIDEEVFADTEVEKEPKSDSRSGSSRRRRRRRKPKLADAIAKITMQRKVISMWVPKSKEPAQETNKEKVPVYRWVPKGSTSGES